ncbi:MAG: phosphotransferase [Anaerolineales bacterium]|nr:phosphotransferase [Anaerolineales bacterium]
MLNRIPKPTYALRQARQNLRPSAPRFTPEEVAAVLKHYAFTARATPQALTGGNSSNIALETTAGRVVLKRYIWPWPHAATEHAVLQRAGERQLPVPRVHLNQTGHTYTNVNGKTYAVFGFVEGFALSNFWLWPAERAKRVGQAGALLAQFHLAMTGFNPPNEKTDGFTPDGQQLVRDLDWHLDLVERFETHTRAQTTRDELEDFLLKLAAPLKEQLAQVARIYALPASQMPRSAIHADFAPKNVLFNEGGVAAILDFGDACVNLRALDVGRAVATFASRATSEVDTHLSTIFLQAYSAHARLTETEILNLPSSMRWRQLRNIVWMIDRLWNQPARTRREELLAFVAARWEESEWLRRHGERLVTPWLTELQSQVLLHQSA